MSHKVKEVIKSNILKIRTDLGFTQKEFGELLGISERSVQKYEAYETTLPLDKALYICKKWNYALDQIYLDYSNTKNTKSKFFIDIRDFIHREDDTIIFSIPNYYWEYLKEINKINNSDILKIDKARLLAEHDGKYSSDANSVMWKCEIHVKDFLSYLKFEDDEILYINTDSDEVEHFNPTQKQIKEVDELLNQITKGDHE